MKISVPSAAHGVGQGALSSDIVEGFNNKVKLTTRKSYGFRTYKAIETTLYHNFGALPEPDFTHRFRRGGKKKDSGFAYRSFRRQ